MKAMITQYLFPYFLAVGIFLALLVASALSGDPVLIVLSSIIFFMALFFTVPLLLYMDYRSARRFIRENVELYNDEERRTHSYMNVASVIAQKIGMPEFVCDYAVKKAIEHTNKSKPTIKEIHGSYQGN